MYRYFYGTKVVIPYSAPGVERLSLRDASFVRFALPEKSGSADGKKTRRRIVVGRVCEDDPAMMIPNENYFEYISFLLDADSQTDDFVSVGARLVIGTIMDRTGLRAALEGFLGADAAFFLDLVSFCVVEEENDIPFEGYALSHPLFDEGKRLFSYMRDEWREETEDYMYSLPPRLARLFIEDWTRAHPGEGARLTFFGHREDPRGKAGDDSDEDEEEGYDEGPEPWEMPDDFFVAFDESGRTPLFYLYNGNGTADEEALGRAADTAGRLGYGRVSFYMEGGEVAPDVYDSLDARDCGYLVDVSGTDAAVRAVRSLKGSFEEKEGHEMKGGKAYGAEAETPFPGEGSAVRRMHVYYIPERREERSRRLDRRLERYETALDSCMEDGSTVTESDWSRLFDLEFSEAEDFTGADGSPDRRGRLKGYTLKKDAVEMEKELYGYFAFVSDASMTTEEAYRVIDSYDPDENVFVRRRRFADAVFPFHDDTCPEDVKDLIEFAALIVRCGIRNAMRDSGVTIERAGVSEEMPVTRAVEMLDDIGVKRDIATGVFSPVCDIDAEHGSILAAFGVTPEDAAAEAERVAGELSFLRARRRRRGRKD